MHCKILMKFRIFDDPIFMGYAKFLSRFSAACLESLIEAQGSVWLEFVLKRGVGACLGRLGVGG